MSREDGVTKATAHALAGHSTHEQVLDSWTEERLASSRLPSHKMELQGSGTGNLYCADGSLRVHAAKSRGQAALKLPLVVSPDISAAHPGTPISLQRHPRRVKLKLEAYTCPTLPLKTSPGTRAAAEGEEVMHCFPLQGSALPTPSPSFLAQFWLLAGDESSSSHA